MLIDWFTVIAQMVNFIVLVGLLRRFLYRPILLAIDARERHLATTLEDAASRKREAERELEGLREKSADFERNRGDMLRRVTEEAEAEQHRLLDEARESATALSEELHASYRADARSLATTFAQRVQREAYAIAGQVLSELASVSLEERVLGTFLERLSALEASEKARFGEALRTSTKPVTVRTNFELSELQRTAIVGKLTEITLSIPSVTYEVSPTVVCGIEIAVQGQKFSWTCVDTLSSLEQRAASLFDGTRTQDNAPLSGASLMDHERRT